MIQGRQYIRMISCGVLSLIGLSESGLAMEGLTSLYWHERASLLSEQQQANGWVLSELRPLMAEKKEIPYQSLYCWDLMLGYSGAKKASLIMELAGLIVAYNKALKLKNQEQYEVACTQCNLFIKAHQHTNNQLKKLCSQARKTAIKPYAKQLALPALVVMGVVGFGFIMYNYLKKKNKFLEPITPQKLPDFIIADADMIMPTPKSLQSLGNCVVTQCRVAQQEECSCGYHTMFNAKFIDDALAQNKKIDVRALQQNTPQAIKEFGRKKNIIPGWIKGNLLEEYAKEIGLAHYHEEDIPKNAPIRDNYCDTLSQPINPWDALDLYNKASFAEYRVFNIISYKHFVLVAVIKRPHTPLHIIYMDSLNTPLANNQEAQNIIQGLYNAITRPEVYYKHFVDGLKKAIQSHGDRFQRLHKEFMDKINLGNGAID